MKLDWKNGKSYEFGNDFPPSGWAWEFLRRNKDYQNDWRDLKIKLGSLAEKYPNLQAKEWEEVFNNHSLFSALTISAAKWGLARFANPDDPYHPVTVEWLQAGGRILCPGRESSVWGDPYYEVVAFDLSAPLAEQLKMAETHLERVKEKRIDERQIEVMPPVRAQPERWPGYLRALDAEASGVATPEIASVLLPHIKNVSPDYSGNQSIRNWLGSGKRLRDFGYANLPTINTVK